MRGSGLESRKSVAGVRWYVVIPVGVSEPKGGNRHGDEETETEGEWRKRKKKRRTKRHKTKDKRAEQGGRRNKKQCHGFFLVFLSSLFCLTGTALTRIRGSIGSERESE